MRRMNWSEEQLRGRRKGDPKKVELARELRSRTTMPPGGGDAERLCMGSRGYLAWLLGRRKIVRGQTDHPGLLET